MHQNISRMKKMSFSPQILIKIYTRLFGGKGYLLYIIHKDFQKKCFDAFELNVNVVDFVHYGKTPMYITYESKKSRLRLPTLA